VNGKRISAGFGLVVNHNYRLNPSIKVTATRNPSHLQLDISNKLRAAIRKGAAVSIWMKSTGMNLLSALDLSMQRSVAAVFTFTMATW